MKKNKFLSRLKALTLTAALITIMTAFPTENYLAASKNRVTTTVSVSKNTELKEDAPYLILELEDDLAVDEEFYLELKNAEWLFDLVTVEATNIGGTAEFELDLVDKDVVAVKLKKVLAEDGTTEETHLPADAVIRVKLASKIKKASASVTIDAEGTVITSDSEGINYAKVNDKGATAKVSEVKSFTTDGELGDITVEEAYAGAFAEELDKNGNFVMTLKLDNSDVEFTTDRNVKVVGTKGLEGVTGTVDLVEDDEIEITIDGDDLGGLEKGGFKISGLEIAAIDDEPMSGSVSIDIESDSFKTLSVQVAKFSKSSLDIKVTPYSSDNKKGLVAGRTGEYKIEIKESSEDTLLDGKRLDFELENGYFIDVNTTSTKTALNVFEKEISLPSELELNSVTLDDTKVIGFSLTVTSEDDETDEYTIKVPATVDLESIEDMIFDEVEAEESRSEVAADSKQVTFGGGDTDEATTLDSASEKQTKASDKEIPKVLLTVTGRAISGEEVEVELADVVKPITVSIEEKVYKLGLKDQEGTDIVITEEDAGMIDKGTIIIAFDDAAGMSFAEAPTVEVTKGDLKLGKGELIRSGNAITGIKFNVSKVSRTASEITISDVSVTADRTVPEGRVGILVGGSALTQDDPVASNTYAKIADTNESDSNTAVTDTLQNQLNNLQSQLQAQQTEQPLKAIFTMGSTAYSVNGTAKQMDGTPYVSANGRTMIPVRYVADACGIPSSNILSSNVNNATVVTILGKTDTVQFKTGSNIMLRNGAQIPMDEQAVVKEGRTYIPVSFAASAFGLSTKYDATTKTVTFSNSAAEQASVTNNLAHPTAEGLVETSPTTSTETSTTNGNATSSDVYDILNALQ